MTLFSPGGLASDGLRVARMRVRSADPDRLRARQRIEAQLAGIDTASLGLPSRALLFVRRVSATIDTPVHRARTGTVAQAVASALMRSLARARRPWFDPDAARADVVLFADEAELVACLLRDWARGAAVDYWWWESVLGSAGVERWLREHVFRRGDLVVPALSLLETCTDIATVIARLPETDARECAAAVAHAFALPMSAADAHAAPAVAVERDDGVSMSARDRHLSPDETTALARLIAIVPEIQYRLPSPAHRRLVALVGAAARAPSWGRLPQFAAAMTALDRIEIERVDPQAILRAVPSAGVSERVRPVGEPGDEPTSPAALRIDTPPPVRPPAETLETRPRAVSTLPRETVVQPAASIEAPTSSMRFDGELEESMAQDVDDRTPHTSAAEVPAAENADATSPSIATPVRNTERLDAVLPPALVAARIQTQYGGIFYLLNAWLAMGLYGDFTAPRAAHFVLSPWDLLALVGRAWFGRAFTIDPVWKVLADLAVRDPDENPGRDVELPDGWLAQHLEVLDARLHAALAVEPADDVALLVCRHHAAIEVTASSVHVHLGLAELPVDIRVAGLDRDPGWIPAAGRAVYFHFA